MKITPLEIRQKDFEKKLRGYDKEEVQAFLQSLSNEWERMMDENKELRIKLEQAEKEVQKLREVETSLFKTLKTAEDTGANLVEQANKAAELHMKETQMKAEGMLNESKSKAKAIIENAEQEAKEIINEVQEGVKELEQNHKTIEAHRDSLIKELMNLASDLVERVEKTDKKKGDFKLEDQIKRVRNLARASEKKIDAEHLEAENKPLEPISVEKIQQEVADKKSQELRKPPASDIEAAPRPEPENTAKPQQEAPEEAKPIDSNPSEEKRPEPRRVEEERAQESKNHDQVEEEAKPEPKPSIEASLNRAEQKIEEEEPEEEETEREPDDSKKEEPKKPEQPVQSRTAQEASFFDLLDDD